jgi:hypothetical protein
VSFLAEQAAQLSGQSLRGNPKSTLLVDGSGHRLVNTLGRV